MAPSFPPDALLTQAHNIIYLVIFGRKNRKCPVSGSSLGENLAGTRGQRRKVRRVGAGSDVTAEDQMKDKSRNLRLQLTRDQRNWTKEDWKSRCKQFLLPHSDLWALYQ